MSQGFTSKSLAGAGNGITDVFINGTKQASTSGACTAGIDFTVPSGVKKITLSLKDVSTSATALIGLRLGDSSGIAVAGYSGTYSQFSNGTSNVVNTVGTTVWWFTGNDAAAYDYDGVVELTLHDAATNTWIVSAQISAISGATEKYDTMVGSISLSGELTTVKLYGNTGNWDAGSVNIQYDNPDPTTISTTRSGIVVQTVFSQDGELATGAAGGTSPAIDDTIPQNTEGTEFMTCSITPKSASNRLKIEVNYSASANTATWMAGFLCQDAIADSLAATHYYAPTSTGIYNISFTHWMTAGTTDSTTFKLRIGSNTSSTVSFNGSSGTRIGGGNMASSITITEYSA